MDSPCARLLAALLALVACPAAAGDPPPVSKPGDVACCRSTDDFPWLPLPAPGTSQTVRLGNEHPRYRFHSGESRFAAFRLPDQGGPYRIEIRALPDRDATQPGGWRVFYPQAVLLDAFHLVTRTADADNALPEPVGGELAPDGAYTLFLPMDPATDEDRYLVIHTVPPAPAPTSSEAWLRSRSPVMRTAFGWRAGASDTGRLSITVTTPATATTAR